MHNMSTKKLSARTRRRKVREEIIHLNQTINSNNFSVNSHLLDDFSTINNSVAFSCSSSENIGSSGSISNNIINVKCKDQVLKKIPINVDDREVSPNYSSILPPFSQSLAKWAINSNIPLNTVNSLLGVLQSYEGIPIPALPKDARTLLKTPSHLINSYREVEPGIYFHFGLETGIYKHLPNTLIQTLNNIKIAIGIDGLPLAKSSGSQFWPILAYIIFGPLQRKSKVFLVGLYHGYEKPKNSDCFISDLVTELINLSTNGIVINNKKIVMTIDRICCDAPAKSFILKIKGHSGFSSCTRCCIEGEYLCNRVCFPYTRNKFSVRTHESYKAKIDEDYHIDEISILTNIPG